MFDIDINFTKIIIINSEHYSKLRLNNMTTVTRTEQIQFKSETIGSLCHASKNLFNASNYLVRQRFFENDRLHEEKGEKGKHLWYEELYLPQKAGRPLPRHVQAVA